MRIGLVIIGMIYIMFFMALDVRANEAPKKDGAIKGDTMHYFINLDKNEFLEQLRKNYDLETYHQIFKNKWYQKWENADELPSNSKDAFKKPSHPFKIKAIITDDGFRKC